MSISTWPEVLLQGRDTSHTYLELVKELQYKLCMLGVPLAGPAIVWGDNKSVVKGASIQTNKLNKKHLGICHHAIHEASAAGIWMVDIADCLTKILSGTAKDKQVGKWMFRQS